MKEVNLGRDKDTGRPRGFAFVEYVDQRSTVLAVDNLNGIQLLGRPVRVDHVLKYRKKDEQKKDGGAEDRIAQMANDVFRSAVGDFYQLPDDYAEEAGREITQTLGADEADLLERRRRKQERRDRETPEERLLRKSRD